MINDPLFYAAALPAVALFGLSKGGFAGVSLVSMPLMSLAVSPVAAAAITLPVLMVQDAVTVWSYRGCFDRKTLLIMAPGGVVGVVLGYFTASLVPEPAVRLLVGLFSIFFCLNAWLKRGSAASDKAAPHDAIKATALGACSGYTSFVIHAGGVPFNMYALPLQLDKRVFVGSGALYFAGMNLAKLPPYLALGQITAESLSTSAMLVPVAVAANLLGVYLVNRVPAKLFYKLIYLLTFAVGLKLVWDGAAALLPH